MPEQRKYAKVREIGVCFLSAWTLAVLPREYHARHAGIYRDCISFLEILQGSCIRDVIRFPPRVNHQSLSSVHVVCISPFAPQFGVENFDGCCLWATSEGWVLLQLLGCYYHNGKTFLSTAVICCEADLRYNCRRNAHCLDLGSATKAS